MPAPNLSPAAYYRYRQNINCQGGGYQEEYNLLLTPSGLTTAPSPAVLQVVYNIIKYRGSLLEANSKIANGVISIETLISANPPEGYQVPHQSAGYPIPMNDPTTNAIEITPAVAIDPQQCMAFKFTAVNLLYTQYHWLRSIRSTWVNQFATLQTNVQAYINTNGTASFQNAGYAPLSTNPAFAIGYFMLYLRDNTQLIQNAVSGGIEYGFTGTAFAKQLPGVNQTCSPTLTGLARKKVGEGWPKIKGRATNFGSSS